MWFIASWLIFVLALAWPAWLALRRLVRWRRWRVRCEACRYDLRGAASSRCPECGHDITTPARLIRFRALLLHGALTIVLLVASHVLNRIEAIQARGWIAAVPTTVLIPYVLSCDEPASFSNSAAAKELVNCRATTPDWNRRWSPFGRPYEGPEIDMARWQWWWAIERSLDFDLVSAAKRTIASSAAESILSHATWQDTATTAQRERILKRVRVNIVTRPRWPVGSEIRIRAEILYSGFEAMDLSLEPTEPDMGLNKLGQDITGRSIPISWPDETTAIGVAARPGPVTYEINVGRWDDSTEQRLEVMRESRTLTTVVPAEEVPMRAVAINPDLLARTPVSLSFRAASAPGRGRCTFVLYLSKCPDLIEALGDSTLALRIRLKRSGEVIAENTIWASTRLPGSLGEPFLDGVVPMSFAVNPALFDALAESIDSPWSVEIEGDPEIALRDFESNSYWAGRHEFKNIPVDRVESGK